ncbi:MAG: ISL3 family transposase [Carboxylicivirga sp.]|jgi:transposase|nr:ISL3 family transposase [Carboxylicivirga sp.]
MRVFAGYDDAFGYLYIIDNQLYMTIKQLLRISKIKISNIEYKQSLITFHASITSKKAKCPVCNRYSYSVHDRYTRTITDLPVFQYSTEIILGVRKFKCQNAICQRKVFTERHDDILPYARRTLRVDKLLSEIAIEMTSGAGSKLSDKLNVKVSRATITRLAYRLQPPEPRKLTVVGVDDWAFRKGVNYGTVLVDMETSKPIDLLPTREGEDLEAWLEKNPGIEIITRDRASSYSSAIDSASPGTLQVADRFHLLMNLSEALDTYFKSVAPKINKLVKAKTMELCQEAELPESKNITGTSSVLPRFDSRLPVFEKVKELQSQNIPKKRIARELGISRNTVRLYFTMDELVPKSHSRRTNIENFRSYITDRISKAGYLMKDIVADIRQMGYSGGNSQAYLYIRQLKGTTGNMALSQSEINLQNIPYIKPLSTRRLAKYIGKNMNRIENHDERDYMQMLLKYMPLLRQVRKLVRKFKKMIRKGTGDIEEWIQTVKDSKQKLPGLTSFARGMAMDIDAVKNAIQLKWSNGPVEGHVNRIKSIKRQMYGRANFELLKRKVLLSQYG